MQVLLHELAIDDLHGIVAWLSEDSAHAGERFLDDFIAAANFVAAHPEAGHPCGPFRRWNLKRFPFHLLYLLPTENGGIWIMVVRHDYRHPRFGMDRTLSDDPNP